jgi:hypothetical protein
MHSSRATCRCANLGISDFHRVGTLRGKGGEQLDDILPFAEQGKRGREVQPLDMRSTAKHLVEASLRWLATAAQGTARGGSGGQGDTLRSRNGAERTVCALHGREVFLWAERVIQLQNEKISLLTTDDQLALLHLVLALLAGQAEPAAAPAPSLSKSSYPAKRKASGEKKAQRGAVSDGKSLVVGLKASNGAAAGLLGLADNLFERLASSGWLPLVNKYKMGSILFEEYLMATDPNSAPLLGWPDDKHGKEARRAGWTALWQIASNLDTSCAASVAGQQVKDRDMQVPSGREDGAGGKEAGHVAGAEECLACLRDLVSRTHRFIEQLPPPTSRTEDGPDEMLVFDPSHNGLRHGQPPLVGLKNRRNTCYINSMLQQLFIIPEFHTWLEGRAPASNAAGGHDAGASSASARVDQICREAPGEQFGTKPAGPEPADPGEKWQSVLELSERLRELFGYLRYSKQRFFDPGEFIKACKCPSRQPPLLDKAHTQDDTMTFLESLMDALSSVHGTFRTDLFKVVEKDRRWVDGTKERRSIAGREKEYLMLEIEDGIGDLDSALAKHFSEELMTGDNRVWNEKTQSKETVWKAPFIEESSLPEVLVVQLKRFKYNMTWDGRMEPHKLNTKVEFGDALDLSDYVRRQNDDVHATAAEHGMHVYELQGLVVHSGQTIHSGHYYSFIKWRGAEESEAAAAPAQGQQKQQLRANGPNHKASAAWEQRGTWYKLDDDTVTQVSQDLVKEESFGGTVESKDQYGEIKRQVHSRSAYVLFYRKRRRANGEPGAGSAAHTRLHLPDAAHDSLAKSPVNTASEEGTASKRQRGPKTERLGLASSRAASGSEEAVKAGVDAESAAEQRAPWLDSRCRESVELASLTAARHSLAFDEDFMLWVQDLVSFACKLSGKVEPMSAKDSLGSLLHEEAPQQRGAAVNGDAQDDGMSTLTDAVLTAGKKPKGALVQPSLNGANRSDGSSSDRDKANIERALAVGVRIPADLVAQICDLALLSLVHVAARADTSSPRWRLLSTLVEKARTLLQMCPAGCRLFLERACARSASGVRDQPRVLPRIFVGREGGAPKSADVWRSWIEMLLIKHPEDHVREQFASLVWTAVGVLCHGGNVVGDEGKPDPPRADPAEGGASEGGGGRKRKATEALDADGAGLGALANGAGPEPVLVPSVELLGMRLLEVAEAALSDWSECTLCAALGGCQANLRDKNPRQLHQYLTLLGDLVGRAYISSDRACKSSEVVLDLAIQNASSYPSLTRVLAETWVRMLSPLAQGTPLKIHLQEVAFDQSHPLSLARWTWLVEWLQRCHADPTSIKVTFEGLPCPAIGIPFYLSLSWIRNELLRVSCLGKSADLPHRWCDMDYAISTARFHMTQVQQQRCDARPRYMVLEVERAGCLSANGSYHYTGFLNTCERAVYTRPAGTSVFVIMTSRQGAGARPQPWLLAECKYGVSWGENGSTGGWQVMHDAKVLAEAVASGDKAQLLRCNIPGLRQILYVGDMDVPTESQGVGEDAAPARCAAAAPFKENSLIELYRPPLPMDSPADVAYHAHSGPVLCHVTELHSGTLPCVACVRVCFCGAGLQSFIGVQ